jgi:hypothetical protein
MTTAQVSLDLTGRGLPGMWMRTHVSITSDVIEGNVTGKTINEITVHLWSKNSTNAGEIKITRNDVAKNPVENLRLFAEALLAEADELEALTIGVSDEEKQAIESIKEAAS